MPDAVASLDQQGVMQISGDLVFANVTALLGQIERQLEGIERVLIDLSGVRDVDSSGLALLLEVMEVARRRSITLRFRGLSEALLGIARLSNVESLLPLDG
ncbi:MAG: STAS domain-containing protein [Sedimenticola sp.]|nr:STAS domain-containing protein [Sedimenticola sp.]